MSLLGVDVGTSGCKAAAFDLEGNQLALAHRDYPLLHPEVGWSELDVENLWQKVREMIRQVNSQTRGDPVQALSVSCQGEATVPIDRSGRALYNFTVSFDHRTIPQAQWWGKTFGAKEVFSNTGMTLHAMYTINKIMWLKENRPEIYSKAVKFLCVEDYLIFRLTGAYVTDWSLAGRTMAFDVVNKCWSSPMLEKAGIAEDLMPTPYPSGTAIGTIGDKVAEDLGFQRGVILATGGHDQPCGALGAGVVSPGMAMNAIGTSDCICTAFAKPMLTDKMLEGNYCCYNHVNPEQYVTVAFSLTGGLLLKWYCDTFCAEEKRLAVEQGRDPYEAIIQRASENIRSLFFLPHFVGSGTPYLDSHSRGALVGLTVDATKEDISRAVLDSVAYEMKVDIEALCDAQCVIEELRTIGGGAKSERWLQIRADCFGLPVSSMKVSEAAVLGAAMLGGIACGRFKDVHDAVRAMVVVKRTFAPDKDKNKQYEEKYQYYKEIYPALKKFNHRISLDS
ncbi:MAG: hypothetical protein HQ546_01330 [Planctomycetes bacterium]|nr:hypothetical protein [Planctomycetota bacterium]